MSTVASDEPAPTKPLGRRAGNVSGMDAVPEKRRPAGIVRSLGGKSQGAGGSLSHNEKTPPWRRGFEARGLLAAESVLQTADGILHLAGCLVRLSFRFQLGIA